MTSSQETGFRGWARVAVLTLVLTVAGFAGCAKQPVPMDKSGPVAGWDSYGGPESGQRYSPLTQVNRDTVRGLKVAWVYHTGDLGKMPKGLQPKFEVTPIIGDGRMYLCSPRNKVIALDPETGRELWNFDPELDLKGIWSLVCRGVTFYKDAAQPATNACATRVYTGTLDGRLIALDARTGKLCEQFGQGGTVNLRAGLGETRPGDYGISSAPVIVGKRVILGGMIIDNTRIDVPAGVVRAFNVDTGALEWAWNPLPPGRSDAEAKPPEPYIRGTTNAWSEFSVDSERGIVYVPTGNTSPDQYGGDRHGLDYYSSSLVALEAATGRVLWHFQTVHHDIWDYDVPAQPVLFELPTAAGPVPAVAQTTKMGHIFILNRVTGVPLFPVEERPVPQEGAVPGEYLSLTQPFPANPAFTLLPQKLTANDIWGFTFWDQGKCREQFAKYRYDGIFTPPTLQGTLTVPSPIGGSNWGGITIDPVRQILIANTTRIATVIRLLPRGAKETSSTETISVDAAAARGAFVFPTEGSPYQIEASTFLSPWGAPCNPPPWGALTAIDLKAGKRLWEVPLGTTRDTAPLPPWLTLGTPNLGGSLITGSGLIFISAATDSYLRAFEVESGAELWKTRLPAGGHATPMTYRLGPDRRQFIVIAAGGHGFLGTRVGDSVIAYALEE